MSRTMKSLVLAISLICAAAWSTTARALDCGVFSGTLQSVKATATDLEIKLAGETKIFAARFPTGDLQGKVLTGALMMAMENPSAFTIAIGASTSAYNCSGTTLNADSVQVTPN